MKKNIFKTIFLFTLATLSITACKSLRNTSKQISIINYSTPLNRETTVQVIGIGQQVPYNVKLLGSVKIGEAGFTKTSNCTYQKVLNDAIEQARTMGGNLIQIIEHKEPDFRSSCHRIKADVYLILPGEIREK